MRNFSRILLCACTAIISFVAFCDVSIMDMTAQQRYPWNGKVDIVVAFAGESNDVAKVTCVFAATNCATSSELTIAHIDREGGDSESGGTWTRHYVWDAAADIGEAQIADVAITVEATLSLGGVQLWENGPYWAECNVGAAKPEEYGYYFWWGDTVGYRFASNYGWTSSRDGTPFEFYPSNCPIEKYDSVSLQSHGYVDSTGNLVASHDAATTHLGKPWRMPTNAEFSDLITNCTTTWTTRNGVYGRLVSGKGNYDSKSIFFPAAGDGFGASLLNSGGIGFYWSSTPDSEDNSLGAWSLFVYSSNIDRGNGGGDGGRFIGENVRPLRGFEATVLATAHIALDTRMGTRYARAEEPIAFSTDWRENVTRLVLNVDGTNVLTTTSATNGVYVWKPDFTTARTVTLKHTTRAPSSNEVMTATFTTEAYDVTFNPGAHGSFTEGAATVQRVPHGEDAVAPAVNPDSGYLFMGWSSSPSNITADASCVACYTPIAYPISYTNLYGATHTNQTTYTVEDAVTFAAPQSIPRRQFVRWKPSVIAAGTTGPVTVQAVWELTPYVYVNAESGDDANDGSTAEFAVKTLARAYSLAENGDVICVAAGSYSSVTATDGKSVTFRAAEVATIDGDGTARCVAADEYVVFENFIFQNGYDAERGGGVCGGTFYHCTITNCTCYWDGGGAYGANLQFCVVVGNEAENGWGGGAYGGRLDHCQVVGNIAGDLGGGVYAPEELSNTMFRANIPEDLSGTSQTVAAGGAIVYSPNESETAYTIPHDWFVTKGLSKYGDQTTDLAAKLTTTYDSGYTGWESYVAGLDPTNAVSKFKASISLSNGMVYVCWTPNLNVSDMTRIYKLVSRSDLAMGEWETPIQPWHRFFSVKVEMPTGETDETSDVSGEGFEKTELGGVQLWENGPYWAECNVGANSPEEFGYYFWWGDTVGFKRNEKDDGWISSKDGTAFMFESGNCPTYGKDIAELHAGGYIDSTSNLVARYDAATVHLGAPWRIPTKADIEELISNCTVTWITTNGVKGRLVNGKGTCASNSIFLPAGGHGYGSESSLNAQGGPDGHYWSSSPDSNYEDFAWNIVFAYGNFIKSRTERSIGLSVRPIRDCPK